MAPKRKHQPEPSDPSSSEPEDEVSRGSESSPSTSDDSDSSDGYPSGGSDEEQESEDDEYGEAFASLQVDFEFFDPSEKDFHGLKALLHTYLDGQQFSCSELVDAIVQQGQTVLGTVIKCGEDEDSIGVCTVLSLRQQSKLKSLGEIKDFLLAHAPEGGAAKEALAKAWGAPGTGLLVSERLLNCPPQLAPPLMRGIFEEVEEVVKDEELEQELRDAFKLKRYIILGRAYVDPEQQQKVKKGKKQKEVPTPATPTLVYATPEAECFHSRAAWSFAFPTPNRPVGKGDLLPHRLVMGVDASQVPAALKELEELVGVGGGGNGS